MCGIAGIIATADAESLQTAVQQMLCALRHRGPDDEGWEAIASRDGRPLVRLANTRLAILDLSPAGHQPMRDPVTGNWIVLNGEIYNYRELRKELGTGDGREWRSASDTEVVLQAYAAWGVRCLDRLRGMFAVALWDQAAQRLVLARDRFGIKPLYYAAAHDRLLFASEVRAVLASELVARRLSPEGLASYLTFGSVETPLTIVRDVQSLPAGHALIAEMRGGSLATSTQRFAPGLLDLQSSAEAGAGGLRSVLEDSVRAHLVSDVPVGAFLSGGIDSSAIVALMRCVSAQTPRTFSVVFEEQRFTEAPYARAIAQRYGTEHTEIALSDRQLLGVLPDALRAMDQPTIDGVNTYVISRAVRQAGITVALSGLGGDELFGGYPSFARMRRARRLGGVPRSLRAVAAGVADAMAAGAPRAAKVGDLIRSVGPREVYVASRRLFPSSDIGALGLSALDPGASRLPAVPADADPQLAISLYELGHYMTNTLLRDTDTMSMAHGLEVRVPFVDREVVAAALAMSSGHVPDGRPKARLLDAVEDLLPAEIWRRPKMGFTLPFEVWMQSQLRAEIDAVFAEPQRFDRLGVRPQAAQHTWHRFLRQPHHVGWSRPWALYVVAQWCALNGVAL